MNKMFKALIISLLLCVIFPFVVVAKGLEELKDFMSEAVVTVETDRGLASGVVLTKEGIILTSEPVTQSSADFYILLDKDSKVKAKLLKADPENGFALLYAAPENVKEKCMTDFMIAQTPEQVSGTIFSLGSPLLNENNIQQGTASDLINNQIITELYPGYKNAGGPVVNKDGSIIGYNYYSEYVDPDTPGVSKVISMAPVDTAVQEVLEKIKTGEIQAPSAEVIQIHDQAIFPAEELKAAMNKNYYSSTYTYNKGPFKVILYSPPLYYNLVQNDKLTKHEIKKKKPRKKKAKKEDKKEQEEKEPCLITKMNPYSPFNELKKWKDNPEQFGHYLMVKVVPKTGHTSGSSARGWASFFLGEAIGCPVYLGSKTMEFKKDFKNMEIYVDGKLIQPVKRGREYNHNLYAEYFKDASKHPVTHSGLYFYNPVEVLKPENGTAPKIEIKVYQSDPEAKPTGFEVKSSTYKALVKDYPHLFD